MLLHHFHDTFSIAQKIVLRGRCSYMRVLVTELVHLLQKSEINRWAKNITYYAIKPKIYGSEDKIK